MALDIRIRPKAKADLTALWRYIAKDNIVAADRMLDRLNSTLGMLSEQSEVGRERPELREKLRSFPVGNYIIYYECSSDCLTVIRVLSGFRDVSDDMVR